MSKLSRRSRILAAGRVSPANNLEGLIVLSYFPVVVETAWVSDSSFGVCAALDRFRDKGLQLGACYSAKVSALVITLSALPLLVKHLLWQLLNPKKRPLLLANFGRPANTHPARLIYLVGESPVRRAKVIRRDVEL